MTELIKNFANNINLLDIILLTVLTYNVVQCFFKGFSLSLISFMKWVLSTIITIILVPKLQPVVSEYIESDFINNIGLGIAIFVLIILVYFIISQLHGVQHL